MSKSLELFIEMSKRCLSQKSIKSLVVPSSYEEQMSFHRIHERLLEMPVAQKTKNLMCDRYPFVKVKGRWLFSSVKMYLYLVAARPALLKTGDAQMELLYQAVQNMQSYIIMAKDIDRELTPTGHINYEDYQEKLSRLYEDALMKQSSIFERLS